MKYLKYPSKNKEKLLKSGGDVCVIVGGVYLHCSASGGVIVQIWQLLVWRVIKS